jgi:DNA-binding CsgD family transcriptional regulator
VRSTIVGREAELATIYEFVRSADPLRSLLLTGGPGIGKTTLWEAGVEAGQDGGLRVLSARPSGSETQVSFATLVDLFDGVDLQLLAGLPAPQRRALEVALLRKAPAGGPPEPHSIAVGFLNVLRLLAAQKPILVAIDDLQWLDAPSANSLAFAARRLEGESVGFLLARRPGSSALLERELERRMTQLEVRPLSLGAMRRLLSERLGLNLSRHLLRRIVDTTLGNPFFALEIGRMLADQRLPAIGQEIPVPDSVEDLLGTRIERVPAPVRRLLLALALSAELRTSQLADIAGFAAVEEGVELGLIIVDGEQARAAHPLLAAAARERSSPSARRDLHRVLARVVVDAELRARHLALAAAQPDEEVAAIVAAAASGASARGARHEAVELAEHALRLTPSDAPARTDRLLLLAGCLDVAGDPQRVADLLVPALESLPSGSARVRACMLLAEGVVANEEEIRRYLDRALAESQGDDSLRARVLPGMAVFATVIRVERIREAEAWALEALTNAQEAEADVAGPALEALAWSRGLRGLPFDLVGETSRDPAHAVYIASSTERLAGQRLAWRGEIDQARAVHTRLQALADEQGETLSYALQGLHLCELELRAGRWERASRLLEEVAALEEMVASSDSQLLTSPIYARCRALLAVGRGARAEADRWVAQVLTRAEESGSRWDELELRRAVGIAALLAHEPDRAAESLRTVWRHMEREGVDEPGVFPVAPDLVEALVELGELEEARAVVSRLQSLAEKQEHPWGLATAKRCRALVNLGSPTGDDAAAADLSEAAAEYRALGLRFDEARTLLLLGRAQRRRRKWAAARSALERAADAFEELGSPGWVEEARLESERVGGRRPGISDRLTPSEQRVVDLAVDGLSNKEIARALFVTVPTVEGHLTRAYAKLGVRSRGQLARLAAEG